MKNQKDLRKINVIRAVISIVMVFAFMISSIRLGADTTYAYESKSGVIVNGNPYVYTRVKASDSSERVSTLENGKAVTVIGETTGDDNQLWYQVTYILKANGQSRTGYCRASNVSVNGQAAVAPDNNFEADAVVIATGTINGVDVYVRNAPGTSGTYKLVGLDRGHMVDVIGQTDVSGVTWYKVNCTKNGTNYTGWTHGKYIDLVYVNVETDEAFEQSLRNAGFPESYIPNLVALHAKYPNWTFVPVHTGLDWNAVINAESKAAVNMVQTSADDAKKSLLSSEYNWNTNKWTIRDGSGWVTANKDYIAYCMDPRNYLTETSIFQFESLSYSSLHNQSGVDAVLKGTFMANDATEPDGSVLNYASAFMSIGQTTGVSPYHLASRVVQEQGAGTSPLISGKYKGYEGYFNYFNVNAFGSPESVLYANGLGHAKNVGWNTRYASLLGGAQLLANNYIAKGQDTVYFQKFNVVYTDKLYSHQYMANVTAAITEGQKIAKAYTDKAQSFVFEIPVYSNMPAEAVKFTASGNPNNYLKELNASGLSLTPSFTSANTEYTMIVDSGVDSIALTAAPVASTSTVKGGGTYSLYPGENYFKINCTSQSGSTRTYNLTVVRSIEETIDYDLTSDTYTIGTYITGVTPGTQASDFLSKLASTTGELKVLNADGTENTGKIATGNKVAIYVDGKIVATPSIVIYGDVNGDGAIDIVDVMISNRYTLGLHKLSGAYLAAGDVDHKNDGISIVDVMMMNRHTLGLFTIQQK